MSLEEILEKIRSSNYSQTSKDQEREGSEFAPVFVVSGSLDAGKNSLLNMMLRRRLVGGSKFLLIQFEHGEEDPIDDSERDGSLTVLRFSIKAVQGDIHEVVRRIYHYLIHHDPEEIWVEWNGVLPFSYLWELFPPASRDVTGTLGDFCQIKKILHLADAEMLERLVAQTGGVLLEQISNSDIAVLRNACSDPSFRRAKRLVQTWDPGVKVLPLRPLRKVERELSRPNRNQSLTLLRGIVLCAAAYLVSRFVLEAWQGSSDKLDTLINVFLGIILQAVPFLLIGVLLSSMIQIFVSQQFIERWFPKHLAGGILFSILAGFCLPVCDCASIPVFRSLIRKGVPITAAMTFMAAAPIIDPVAILRTWYTFNGDMSVVLCRIGLGLLCAVLIGLTFSGKRSWSEEMTLGAPAVCCVCGCYDASSSNGHLGQLFQTVYPSIGTDNVPGVWDSCVSDLPLGPRKDPTVKSHKVNTQAVIEAGCFILFGVAMLYLLYSGKYLSHVTPRIKPYLYFTISDRYLYVCRCLWGALGPAWL